MQHAGCLKTSSDLPSPAAYPETAVSPDRALKVPFQ